MRKFAFNTVGKILARLKEEGVPIPRSTFDRLEKRLEFPVGKKTSGKLKWRVYTDEEIEVIVDMIKLEYNVA